MPFLGGHSPTKTEGPKPTGKDETKTGGKDVQMVQKHPPGVTKPNQTIWIVGDGVVTKSSSVVKCQDARLFFASPHLNNLPWAIGARGYDITTAWDSSSQPADVSQMKL